MYLNSRGCWSKRRVLKRLLVEGVDWVAGMWKRGCGKEGVEKRVLKNEGVDWGCWSGCWSRVLVEVVGWGCWSRVLERRYPFLHFSTPQPLNNTLKSTPSTNTLKSTPSNQHPQINTLKSTPSISTLNQHPSHSINTLDQRPWSTTSAI